MENTAYKLADICKLITDGKHGDCINQDGSGYYFISAKDIREGNIQYQGARQITAEDFLDTHRRTQLEKGDVLITNSGTIGRMALTKDAPETKRTTFQKSVAILKPNHEYVSSEYLYYYLLAENDRLCNFAGGTSQKNLLLRDMRAFDVEIPDSDAQKNISSVLAAYDNLIENNNRRIAILEEMAQSLYREWFVKFRFPGYENTKFIDSQLGKIPEGWEVKKLSEVISIDRGRSYKSSELVEEGGYAFLNLKNIAREGGFRRDGLKRYDGPFKSHQTAKPNDIIMAVTDMTQERAIIARSARVPNMGIEEFVFSMDLIKLTVKEGYKESFIYSFLRYSDFPGAVKQFANGANVLHLSPKVIESYEALIPENNVTDKYVNVVRPIHEIQDKLEKKNDNLKSQRDSLLPKLVSGNIEIK